MDKRSAAPLVSIMMPCYNAAHTLPWALASLLVQTYPHWECVLVDDGSEDFPSRVVERIRDPRIRFIQLQRNRGRGFARQVALDHAEGQFLCMLDADDWIFPDKIERQVKLMVAKQELALLSTGMSIVDQGNNIVGVRAVGELGSGDVQQGFVSVPSMPPVAHAPSMIRMEVARQAQYDARFRLAQDVDFLLQILLGRRYGILADASYVYTEHSTTSLSKITSGLRYTQRMFWKYRRSFPVTSALNIGMAAAKIPAYRIAYSVGLGPTMIRRRSAAPTEEQVSAFRAARVAVHDQLSQLWPGQKAYEA